MPQASPSVERYFSEIYEKLGRCYDVARRARSLGFDPEAKVDIPLAKNMAERVEGLISAVKPGIVDSGLSRRIEELEAIYGTLSLDVAMVIADEVASGRFCSFSGRKEAMEVGIRTGFAYLTIGVVSAPLEGFTDLVIKKRRDGDEYLAAMFSGPVRGAGGTAIALVLVVADYVRRRNGYSAYDPDSEEVSRACTELDDYHERVTNLQYRPSDDEIAFLVNHCPIEIDGSPTEKLEVSQHKDILRIETNRIRGGVCLVLSMLALKAKKLSKEVARVQGEFDIDWRFLDEFLRVQNEKKSHSKGTIYEGKEIVPDYTFISDLVAGRPVLTYPMQSGGFRLRYGRTRISGYSAASISPATMIVLDSYIATGTQLKVERPGKAAAVTPCDAIDGPIVKLADGSVLRFDTEQDARAYRKEVIEILYLGDFLVSYGDFYDRNHILAPPGYCEEWHERELELSLASVDDAEARSLASDYSSFRFPSFPPAEMALGVSLRLGIPLHPRYTYFWNSITVENLDGIVRWLKKARLSEGKLVLPASDSKRSLEILGVPHRFSSGEFVVVDPDDARAFLFSLGIDGSLSNLDSRISAISGMKGLKPLEVVNRLCQAAIRDKAGTFIGARMGRPEKAKMRKLTGNPQVLFPVGDEGGRLRSVQAAIDSGMVVADFPIYLCKACRSETIYGMCEKCSSATTRLFNCSICGRTESCSHNPVSFEKRAVDIRHYFESACRLVSDTVYPDLVKGVRGTANRDHIPENLVKGILRAKHGISVNKDGTTRYDMSELPITHFTPEEVGTSVEKLVSLGYETDIHGRPLYSPGQVLEILPQDVILPSSPESVEDNADVVLLRVASFVDELLTKLYRDASFYSIKSRHDLVGELVIGLAPHISAGIVGRIVGFSKTQAMLAHPLFHAAMRRDADGDEACVMLAMDALLNFSRQYLPDSRGAKTMDSPLVLTPKIIPAEVDDMAHRLDVAWRYPLEFYDAALSCSMPSKVSIELLGSRLGTPAQYEGLGYTHSVSSINSGVILSAYKTLPSMEEKLRGQMVLAEKIRAVDSQDVARLVIEKHLLKDVRGNLRKFSNQQFRCVKCNRKFRRPPLAGNCDVCGGSLLFTVSEGSVVKYLEPAISLAEKYVVPSYVVQVLALTKQRIAEVFGREKDRQEGLGKWFG